MVKKQRKKRRRLLAQVVPIPSLPSQARPLPPLSLEVLTQVERVEGMAREAISDYWNSSALRTDSKLMRSLRACVVQSFNLQLVYYATNYDSAAQWLSAVEAQALKGILDLLPISETAK